MSVGLLRDEDSSLEMMNLNKECLPQREPLLLRGEDCKPWTADYIYVYIYMRFAQKPYITLLLKLPFRDGFRESFREASRTHCFPYTSRHNKQEKGFRDAHFLTKSGNN
jgi:hypothetical protein